MNQPGGTKKQHFVPQLLLRQFADKDEMLFAYDMERDQSFRTTVRDAGQQNHFLSIPSLDGADGPGAYYERLFQSYEGPAMDAIRRIRESIDRGDVDVVGAPEREALSSFLALQYARTPAARDMLVQTSEVAKRAIATEIAKRNGIDVTDRFIVDAIDKMSRVPPEKRAELHAEVMLKPAFINNLAAVLAGHVWVLGTNRTGVPLYVADHPISLYDHVGEPEFGLGLGSYGVEIVCPLSSWLQLSIGDREFTHVASPELESLDGRVLGDLAQENVIFERSLQVMTARRFVYCLEDDFEVARRACERDPDLRTPNRPRMEVVAFGHVMKPNVGQ